MIYELIADDGELMGYVAGMPRDGEPVSHRQFWMPDGTRPEPGHTIPSKLLASMNTQNLHPCHEIPDFLR